MNKMSADEVDKVIINFINNDTEHITNSKAEVDEIEQINHAEASIIQKIQIRVGRTGC